MLARLIGFSIRHASFVVIASGLLLVFAGLKLREMPVDVFPELNAPTVVIMTEAGGLAADEVESFVTFPIETSVNGLAGTRRVRSASATSLSIVWVEFDWGMDLGRARQLVAERLAAVEDRLPPDVHAEIVPTTSIRSDWRGVKRGKVRPKRSVSNRGPVTDMYSMPQHAVTKGYWNIANLRAQARASV